MKLKYAKRPSVTNVQSVSAPQLGDLLRELDTSKEFGCIQCCHTDSSK